MNIVRTRGIGRIPVVRLMDLDSEFERSFGTPLGVDAEATEYGNWQPRIDLYEDKEGMVVKAELPGLSKDDVEVDVENNVLMLKGTKKREEEVKEGGYYRCERFYGSFQRSFELPAGIDGDKVKAELKDGVLSITLPRNEAAKPRKVDIAVN